ncbi:MAG TPA: hypothetical protein PKX38_04695 [Alphaproteobacteria bacterium]|jgi:hypothetical protein|nr:hypothetical protein [Micavibrio sp.]MBK9562890.1 hypothetical protein [Micavibrio sp.]HQX27219.1 hypothetical protein [Alphaproteobacteria bacterium]
MADTSKLFSLSAVFSVAALAAEVVLNAWMHLDPTGMAFMAKIGSMLGFTSSGGLADMMGVSGFAPT